MGEFEVVKKKQFTCANMHNIVLCPFGIINQVRLIKLKIIIRYSAIIDPLSVKLWRCVSYSILTKDAILILN